MPNRAENNFTNEQLKESYWIVAHKDRVFRIARRAAIGIEAALIAAVLVQFAGYVWYAANRHERIVRPLIALANYRFPVISLEQPRIISQGAIDRGTGSFDIYAVLENPHTNWRADANIVFTFQDAVLPSVRATLLPGERKYVLRLGVSGSAASSAQARVEGIAWTRVSEKEKNKIQTVKNALRVSDFELRSGRTESGTIIPGTRLRFTMENTGVYALSDIRVPVVVKHGETPVAAASVPVVSLARNQKIMLEARWDYVFAGTEYDIAPDIDPLNPSRARPSL